MEFTDVIKGTDINKKFKNFVLDIPELRIPKGFATALIGENGAGKTTLMNILAGIRLDYKGELRYFDEQEKDVDKVKERLGYTGPGLYFLPHWNLKQVAEVSELLFDAFDKARYEQLCRDLGIGGGDKTRTVSKLSDGNKMKLVLAAVLARKTDCLLMDEPASPLDPLMRDRLCEIIREYLDAGDGEHSVFFSTHNVADMENVTDYAMILEHGKIVEQGFVEELKEKYILVKGEPGDAEAAKKILYSYSGSNYGFEGICLAQNLDQLAGMDVKIETPSLSQISVAVMKAHTNLQFSA
ncbi:MAG: ABC transporter ATP-binding protein [Acetatifactor sp.]|nr:ABC transporter ATP-binding protein [Acetatifactor sp.]